jgi:putative transposase
LKTGVLILFVQDNNISKIYSGWTGHFITIVTRNRINYLGEIKNGEMHHSVAGVVAGILWSDVANCRSNVIRSHFFVMPNHLHGILLIRNKQPETDTIDQRFAISLESIIRLYKGAVKKYCNIYKVDFNWQSSFHCHTFQTETEYRNFVKYIEDNIKNWINDPQD